MPTAFPFACHWPARYRERRAYQTDVLVADDGTEQRIRVRQRPRRRHAFTVRMLDPREAGQLEVALHQGPEVEWAVPFWPHATRLTADAAMGAGTLSLDPTDRDFVAGQTALLWASAASAELVTIDTVGASSLTLTGTLAAAWPARTVVVPCHAGRIDATISRQWLGSRATDVPVAFDLDPLQLPASASDGTAAAAVVALGAKGQPNRAAGPGDTWARVVSRLEADAGGFTDLTWADDPVATQERFRLHCNTRALARDVWDWYDARLGALNPAWVPTYQTDLALTGAVQSTDPSLTIEAIGYAARLDTYEARRHLALIRPATGQVVHRRVASAVDNLDGTETLTLDANAGLDIPAGQGKVAFLRYVRLAADAVEMTWYRPGLAEVDLAFTELPLEAPATV